MNTFRDVRASRIPGSLGLCASDSVTLASYINEATQRLLQSGGDTGWWGTWVKMAFNITQGSPYVTTPRGVARLINIDLCRVPIRIQNEFYEFLEFGVGLQRPNASCGSGLSTICASIEAFDRGMYPTMTDITPGNKVRVVMANSADKDKRIFFNAVDSNGNQIYDLDNGIQVEGFFLSLVAPFVDSPMNLNSISGIQKDITLGPVSIYQVDANGTQSLLSTLAPDEQNTAYRRYFLQNLPPQCLDCDSPANVVQITAMAKREFVPVANDTDYLLIGNLPALKEECASIRYSEMDNPNAQKLSIAKHVLAIRLLNQELVHYLGKEMPALNLKPFGDATLEKINIGMM